MFRCRMDRQPAPYLVSLFFPTPGGFGVSVGTSSEHGHKNLYWTDFARLRVLDRDGRPGIVDEKIFADAVLLAQNDVELTAPALVEFVAAAVAVAAGMSLDVLFPQQPAARSHAGAFAAVRGSRRSHGRPGEDPAPAPHLRRTSALRAGPRRSRKAGAMTDWRPRPASSSRGSVL